MPKREHSDLYASPGAANTSLDTANTSGMHSKNEEAVVLPTTKRPKLLGSTIACTEAENANTESALLKLSGEILNKIYELVLTSEDNLLAYVNGSDSLTNDGFSDTDDTESLSSPDHPSHASPDEQDSHSEVVSDPGNSITSIASISGGVQAHYLQKDGREFNQLKYVCKKFWRETHRLELQFNGMVLKDLNGTGIAQTELFITALPPYQRRWLKQITILNVTPFGRSDEDDIDAESPAIERMAWCFLHQFTTLSDTSSKLEAFCYSHPWISVRLVLEAFELTGIEADDGHLSVALVTGVFGMYYMLRNTLPTQLRPLLRLLRGRFDRDFERDANTPPILQAPNLRVYPRNLLHGINVSELMENIKDEEYEPYFVIARECLARGL